MFMTDIFAREIRPEIKSHLRMTLRQPMISVTICAASNGVYNVEERGKL